MKATDDKEGVTMYDVIENIEELLTQFDEFGFVPSILVPDPNAFAIDWKHKIVDTLNLLFKQYKIDVDWEDDK